MNARTDPDFANVFESLPARGWLTKGEASLLWNAVRLADGPILEVGSYCGRSTCLLARVGRIVHAVDPFTGFDTTDEESVRGDVIHDVLMDNLRRRGLTNVVVHRCRVEDWTPVPCGFAYLDGDHTFPGTLAQIDAALATGATIIAVHDYSDHGGGIDVRNASVERLGPPTFRMERLAVWVDVCGRDAVGGTS